MTYWILNRTQPTQAEDGRALVSLTDGRDKRLCVALTADSAGREALAANSYADGPDALLLRVAEAWFWKKKAQPVWDPKDEVLTASDIKDSMDHIGRAGTR